MTTKSYTGTHLYFLLSIILCCTSLSAQETISQNLFILKRLKDTKDSYEQVHLKGDAVSQLNIEKYLEKHVEKFDIRITGKRIFDLESQSFEFNSENMDVNTCTRFCQQKESEARAFLGISMKTVKNLRGAKIASVISASAAEKMGLQAEDVITQVDELIVHSPCDLNSIISEYYPGDRVKITYLSNEEEKEKEVVLGARLQSTITWVTCCESPEIGIAQNNEDKALSSIYIAPNPNTGFFQLNFELVADETVIIRMTDNAGREVYKEILTEFNGFYHKNIDVSNEAAGIYYLNVIQKNKVISKKVVLQKS